MSGLPKGFPPVPEMEQDEKEHRRELAKTVNRINMGKVNCTLASFTLNASQTSTTLTDPRIFTTSFLWFMPTTANAAAALASIWVAPSTMKKGSAVVTHASSANVDQTFTVLILG